MLGLKIKRLRLQKGITQQDLIEGLFDRSYLSQIEHGKRIPPIGTLEILAQRLGVPMNQLTDYSETTELIKKTLEMVRENKDLNAIRQAWDAAARVQAIEQMIECVLTWAKIQEDISSSTVELLEAINHTVMLVSSAGEDLNSFLDLLMVRANTYFYLGMFDQAIWAYRDLEKRRPPNELLGRIKVSLGSSLMNLVKYQEAYQQFTDVLRLSNIKDLTQARAHHGLGVCCRHVGQWSDAVKHFEKACQLFLELEYYRYMQTRHNLGVLWLDKLAFDKAKIYFEEVKAYYNSNEMRLNEAELCEEFARAEFYQKNYESCNEWCNRGLKLLNGMNAPLAGRFFLWKSWVFRVTKESDKEEDFWEAARSLLGPQLKTTLEFIDPNMSSDIKSIIKKRLYVHRAR